MYSTLQSSVSWLRNWSLQNTPRSITKRQLRGCMVNNNVRQSLLFHNVIIQGITEKMKVCGLTKRRQLAAYSWEHRKVWTTTILHCQLAGLSLMNRIGSIYVKNVVAARLLQKYMISDLGHTPCALQSLRCADDRTTAHNGHAEGRLFFLSA